MKLKLKSVHPFRRLAVANRELQKLFFVNHKFRIYFHMHLKAVFLTSETDSSIVFIRIENRLIKKYNTTKMLFIYV